MAKCKIQGCHKDVEYNSKTGKPFDFCRKHYTEFILNNKHVQHTTKVHNKKPTKPTVLSEAQKFIKDSKKNPPKKKVVKKIDTREYYAVLKNLIDQRYNLEDDQRYNWTLIKRGSTNLGNAQKALTEKIGNTNHQINKIISELIKYGFNQYAAMKLAYDFSNKEYDRISKIKTKWEDDVYEVEYGDGKDYWLATDGHKHYSSDFAYKYIKKQELKLARLQTNIDFIYKYI